MSEPDAHAWGAEVFKRLWQSGSNADFHMLAWRGDYGMIDSALHYQHNAWLAQRTGGALKRYIEAAQPVAAKRVLMTQSLGNMVACEALREGLQVGQYYMFDAAIPSEAIDETLRAETQDDEAFAKYVPHAWKDYTNACWAANWHRFFKDDPNDARGKMGWPNRFQDALANATEVLNYYSGGDSVFTEEEEAPSLSDDVVHWGLEWYLGVAPCPTVDFTLDNHSWQKQEVMKGAAKVAGTLSGGWGFNIWTVHDEDSDESWGTHYTPEGASAALADGSITNRPVFNVSDATELMNSNATEDDIFLALAKHVPALSSPVGGNAVLDDDDKCIDMNDSWKGVSRPNGWGRSHPVYGNAWLHSDMKDMAYFYVFKLYSQLVEKGDLQ